MSHLFARLFNHSRKSADGFTQPQREALVDLLNFCSYADDRLTLAEDRIVADQLAQCQWEPAVPLELFVSRSVTRVRDALESPDRRASFLADVNQRLGEAAPKQRALELCKRVLRADGDYTPAEQTVFGEIERAFAETG